MKPAASLAAFLCLLLTIAVLGDEATAPHAEVTYTGIDTKQATALAETLSAAWKVYTEEFGFDLPPIVRCEVTCAPDQPTRLYTDGQDHLFLSLPSKEKLARPAKSGVFNLYGMCHELGHMVMYRVLKDRDWMSSAAAEGWAHFAGSAVVDRVFAAKGESLWPDPYDYRQDGSTRLDKELAGSAPSDVSRAAGEWRQLEKIVGPRGLAKVFAAWQAAGIDPVQPAEGLRAALARTHAEKKTALDEWWNSAAGLLVEKRAASDTQALTIAAARLTGRPRALAPDDNGSEGKKSIAGGGHARQFERPGGGDWYLRAVSFYGARYGPAKAPDTTFDIALCDDQLRPIAAWKKPYASFERGDLTWVRLEVPPTRVPKSFYVCLNFRPTANSGVYVGFDTSTKGASLVGTPGKPGKPFEQGDWMIRVELDQPKEADALQPGTP